MTDLDANSHRPDTHADVRIGLTGAGSERRFVIQNLGAGEARKVRLALHPLEGKTSPLLDSEVAQKLPIERLEPRALVTLSAVITTGTGLRFRTRLTWRNADGSQGEVRESLEV